MTQPIQPESPRAASWRFRPTGGEHQAAVAFWLLMLALGTLVWGSVTWAASGLLAKKGPEKLLRLDLHLPKLNISHTSEHKSSQPELPTQALHWPSLFGSKVAETPPHPEHLSTAEPPRLVSEPSEPWTLAQMPAGEGETCDEPVVYLQPCTLQRGDSPMMRTWKTVSMISLLAGAVTLAPPPLFAQEEKGIVGKDEPLNALKKSVDALTVRIGELEKKKLDVDGINETMVNEFKKLNGTLSEISKSINSVKLDVNNLKATQIEQKAQIDELAKRLQALEKSGPGPVAAPKVDKEFMDELRELRGSIKALQDTVAKLGPTEKHISAYPNGNGAAVKTGKVVLVNLSSDMVLFVINGSGYRLAPGASKVLENVPAGALHYEAFADGWGLLQDRLTMLPAGDTFTLAANRR